MTQFVDSPEDLNPKPLTLSILQPLVPRDTGILTLKIDDGAPQQYLVNFATCTVPECKCSKVTFLCLGVDCLYVDPLHEELWEFQLDIQSQSVASDDDSMEEELDAEDLDEGLFDEEPYPTAEFANELARRVCGLLTPEDWCKLRKWFAAAKLDLIELSDGFECLEDLPEIKPGVFISYPDIFPWGTKFYFNHGKELWAAIDLHCLDADSSCTLSGLHFLKVHPTDQPSDETNPEQPRIQYDYLNGKPYEVKEGWAGAPAASKLLEELKNEYPELGRELSIRRDHLASIYASRAMEDSPENDFKLTPEELKMLWGAPILEVPSTPPEPVISNKIGRNEPCPCGSGKKYKKCCGK